MEASFKSRVEQAFGALQGSSPHWQSAPQLGRIPSSSSSGGANSWSVSEVVMPCNQGSGDADESSGSESDQPCALRYEKFVDLAKRARRRQERDDDEGFDRQSDLDELNDLADNMEEARASKPGKGEEPMDPISAGNGQEDPDEEEECRQVRLMVGMDDTLDFEEEEDEYDKVAVGREGAGERVYMREITGGVSDMSPLTPLPVSVSSSGRRTFQRDSRANHAAAAARLEEDDRLASIKTAEVAKILSLASFSGVDSQREPSGNGVGMNVCSDLGGSSSLKSSMKPALKSTSNVAGKDKLNAEGSKWSTDAMEGGTSNGTPHQNALQREDSKDSLGLGSVTHSTIGQHEEDTRMERKSKRVRFAVDDVSQEEKSVPSMGIQKLVAVSPTKNSYGRVPDYVLNPSKYTHYTLEWSDEEDDYKSNLTAFQETRTMTCAAEEHEAMDGLELPKSITFTPRSGGGSSKSSKDAKLSKGAGIQHSLALVSFAEEVVMNSSPQPEEVSHLTPSTNATTEAKTTRIFRKREREEEPDDTNEKAVVS